jgi:hypothetical protein
LLVLRVRLCCLTLSSDAAALNDGGFGREGSLRLDYQTWWLFYASDTTLPLNVVLRDHDLLGTVQLLLVFGVNSALTLVWNSLVAL